MNLLEPVFYGFAVWRLASLLIDEDGPWNVFARLRHRVGVDDPGEIKGIAFLFTCIYCMSVWISAAIWLAIGAPGNIFVPLAYSAVAIGYHHALSNWQNRQ